MPPQASSSSIRPAGPPATGVRRQQQQQQQQTQTQTQSAASARSSSRPLSSLSTRKPVVPSDTASTASTASRSQTSQGFHSANSKRPIAKTATSTGTAGAGLKRPTTAMDQLPPLPRSRPIRGNEIFRRLKLEVLDAQDPAAMFPVVQPQMNVDASRLHNRLIALAQDYTGEESRDLCSASLYSYLALTLFPASVPARKSRAKALLLAGQGATFPFMPHRSAKGGAAAALAILEQGPPELFADVECAHIWAQACRTLGREKEAEEVLTWCFQDHPVASSSSSTLPATATANPATLPPLTTLARRKEAIDVIELADLQKRSRRYNEAAQHLLEARQRDPWNWTAWIGLCEIGGAPDADSSFADGIVQHVPQTFLDAVIVSLGGDPSALPPTQAPSNSASATRHPPANADEDLVNSAPVSQHARPGSRATTGHDASSSTTAKRTKSASIRSTAGTKSTATNGAVKAPGIAATGPEDGSAGPPERRATVRSTTASTAGAPMTRTLSQARTNERPPSSSSSASRSDGGPEKEKELAQARGPAQESVNVTRDSLRRSTRSQVATSTATNATARRGAVRGAAPKDAASASATRGSRNGSTQTAKSGSATVRSTQQQRPGAVGQAPSALRRQRSELASTRADAPSRALANGESSSSQRTKSHAQLGEGDLDEVAENIRRSTLQKAAEEASKWQAVDAHVLHCLRLLGGAYKDAREYKGEGVLRAFSSHVESGLAEATMRRLQESADLKVLFGRVHHDMAQYVEAEQCFQAAARSSGDTWLADMDIYSLVLFHLSRQEKLSALAQQLMSIDPDAAETHLAVGNLFSLNASPAIALRSFRRACLSAPHYAHSYTLAGHECRVLNQPLKALRFFREALRVDPRHWNGWSGIGMLLCSENQWKGARTVLAHACGLNPSNAQLWDVFGIASEQMNDRQAALEGYTKATLLNPKSAGATIRKGELLWKMHRLEAAHNALLQAVALSPNEPQVHLRLAQSYMRRGGGSFAPLSMTRSVGGDKIADDSLSLGAKAKAVGESALPARYQQEIARHLATAVDLEPSLSRRVKALTEGVGATLRGQTGNPWTGNGDAQPGGAPKQSGAAADRSIGSSFSGVEQSYQYDDEDGEEYSYDDSMIPSEVEDYYVDEDGVGVSEGIAASGAIDDSMGVLRDEEGGEDESGDEEDEGSEGGGDDDGDGSDGEAGDSDEDISDVEHGPTGGDAEGYGDESADLVEASFPVSQEDEMSLE